MRKLFLTLSLAVATVWSYAQETNPNAPEITFEQKTIDYGTIEQGANGKREFQFTNTGKEPLIITKATGSCGCTVPTYSREPIPPGEAGVITVKYDTKRVGAFTKTVTVNSNAKTPSTVLKIKGVVKKVDPVKTDPVKEEKTSMMQSK